MEKDLRASILTLGQLAGEETLPARGFFLGRVAGIDVHAPRETVLARLAPYHFAHLEQFGLGSLTFATVEQVHGAEVAVIEDGDILPPFPIAGADGLATNRRDLALGIYVADCAAVFLVDRHARAVALVHSGKKGTEAHIVPCAIRKLHAHFGVPPKDIVVIVSPCIRPPAYEVDFAAAIRKQARAEGVIDVRDAGLCTASDPVRFYSYRREKGLTGRMLAVLALGRD